MKHLGKSQKRNVRPRPWITLGLQDSFLLKTFYLQNLQNQMILVKTIKFTLNINSTEALYQHY